MNWLTNYVRPKLQKLVQPKDIPDNLWEKCKGCGRMIFRRELDNNLQTCPQCGHHMRMEPKARLDMLFDDGAYTVVELPKVPDDPLKFKDLKSYEERLKDSRRKIQTYDAIMVAHGAVGGQPAVIGVFDFRFMGGSMGTAVGEAIITAAQLAALQQAALILVPSSGGARMQEGMLSLMQMARTTLAVTELKQKGLPYIVIFTDPTTGGVTASFAMLGDIALAEPGSTIGFAGARVIEQTIRETLPKGFQRAEYLYEHGMIDRIVPRQKLRGELINILSLLRNTEPTAAVVPLGGPRSVGVSPGPSAS